MAERTEKQSNKKRWFCCVFAVMLFAVCAVAAYPIYVGNKTLETHEYKIESELLPVAFDGYKIAQVSDLHNAEFGQGNKNLLSELAKTAADVILLTGDLIDSRKTNVEKALQFVEKAVEIAPTYYVTGNHEERIPETYNLLKTGLIGFGVTVLENEGVWLEKEGARIRLIGLKDPACVGSWNAEQEGYVRTQLNAFVWGEEYTVLLSHRPELFDLYAERGVDLVFSGHAHGGQFRLPKMGGLFAPDQGFFPKYDAGLYEKGRTKMLVSRGLGNSLFPFRVNNNPEIVVAVLCKK